MLDGFSQCDLLTEHYENLLSVEKDRCRGFEEELNRKSINLSEIESLLIETRAKFDAEIACLNEKITTLQVQYGLFIFYYQVN